MFDITSLSGSPISDSLEIAVMLIGAFFLGMLFSHALSPRSQVKPVKKTVILESEGDTPDDLQLIEGIGPALEKILHKNNIFSYTDVLQADVSGLEEILLSAGTRYAKYSPATWPDQANLAMQKKWSELEEYQEILGKTKKK